MLAILFEQLYSGPFAVPVLLFSAIGWALLATWRYRQVSGRRLEDKYLDYRVLAEASRIHFFWHLAGLPDNPADHYLRDQRDELEWLRQAIRTLDLPHKQPEVRSSLDVGVRIAWSAWVKSELEYFRKSGPFHATSAERLSTRANRWFITAICGLIFTAVFHEITNILSLDLNALVIPFLTVVYAFAFAVSGTIKVYESVMAHQEQAHRYTKMGIYFDLCNDRIERALGEGDIALAQNLLLEIGRQSLAENADWLLMHRQRPIEVPLGG